MSLAYYEQGCRNNNGCQCTPVPNLAGDLVGDEEVLILHLFCGVGSRLYFCSHTLMSFLSYVVLYTRAWVEPFLKMPCCYGESSSPGTLACPAKYPPGAPESTITALEKRE